MRKHTYGKHCAAKQKSGEALASPPLSKLFNGEALLGVFGALFPCVGINVSLGRPIVGRLLVRRGLLVGLNAGAVLLSVSFNFRLALGERNATQ